MAKALLPNQCGILHLYYPVADCCLCNAREEIALLKIEVERLREEGLHNIKVYDDGQTVSVWTE